MPIQVAEVLQQSPTAMVVVLESPDRQELTGDQARKIATQVAGQSGMSRPGFSGFLGTSYVTPDGRTLDDNALVTPGVFVPGGTWRQECKVQGGL